jgi:hypothetical protein
MDWKKEKLTCPTCRKIFEPEDTIFLYPAAEITEN